MPNFAIIFTDLKEMATDKNKKPIKVSTKAKTDVGAIKRKKQEEEKENKTKGSSFDVKHFKGNSHIFQHMTEFQLSMLNEQPTMSKSIEFKKKKNTGYGEDFGIRLPDEGKKKATDLDTPSDDEGALAENKQEKKM